MSKIVEWTPSDYSPTYRFKITDSGDFDSLLKVFDMPPHYEDHKELEIEQHYIDYMSGKGFDKYKSNLRWLKGE